MSEATTSLKDRVDSSMEIKEERTSKLILLSIGQHVVVPNSHGELTTATKQKEEEPSGPSSTHAGPFQSQERQSSTSVRSADWVSERDAVTRAQSPLPNEGPEIEARAIPPIALKAIDGITSLRVDPSPIGQSAAVLNTYGKATICTNQREEGPSGPSSPNTQGRQHHKKGEPTSARSVDSVSKHDVATRTQDRGTSLIRTRQGFQPLPSPVRCPKDTSSAAPALWPSGDEAKYAVHAWSLPPDFKSAVRTQ
eukprot:IDg3798t1